MSEIVFKDKFVGFADILGFKKLVEAAEAGNATGLNHAREVLKECGSSAQRDNLEMRGPKICPRSKSLQRNLDFRVTQVSDSLLVSSEVSPAGVINLVEHLWYLVFSLLQKGLMCRGYIMRGSICHESNGDYIGTVVHKIFEKEQHDIQMFKREVDERGTPFVEVDPSISEYIATSGDDCVKKVFQRFVVSDGSLMALFPFQRLAHQFLISGFGPLFDAERERHANNNVRLAILRLKEKVLAFVDNSNPSAVRKAEHYIQALNNQLRICDRTDEVIKQLVTRPRWPYS